MRKFFLPLALLTWLLAIVFGLKILFDYSKTPGLEGKILYTWPTGTLLKRESNLPILVMSVHSMCSCTRASLEELAKILRKTEGKLTAAILLLPVDGQSDEDLKLGYTWKRASETPGVRLYIDHYGLESKRFGALVSGKVMLYDTSGKLIFHGGITPARGHEGDNAGRDQILSWVNHPMREDERKLEVTPVFGCSLFESEAHSPK